MNDSATALIADMTAYLDAAELRGDTDADLAPAFAARVAAFGAPALIIQVFRTFADSELTYRLKTLGFAWKDFSYQTWLDILAELASERRHVYQFLWFAGWALGWDVRRLDVAHENVRAELASSAFCHGGAVPMPRATRVRCGDEFDYEAVWARLTAQGAPMLTGLSGTRGHAEAG